MSDYVMRAMPYTPDCGQGKHKACTGEAWGNELDERTTCACGCHTEKEQA